MDISNTITPKSDQLNADDLIVSDKTITITKVTGKEAEIQPISIHFEGDDGKPYKPCKSMRRLLIMMWGANASQYIGRKLTLYRDPSVMYAGIQVGGIRISHMSDIEKDMTVSLTASKTVRKPYTVKPLASLPDLNPEHPHWAAVMAALKDGSRTMEQIKSKFTITETNEKLLLS